MNNQNKINTAKTLYLIYQKLKTTKNEKEIVKLYKLYREINSELNPNVIVRTSQ